MKTIQDLYKYYNDVLMADIEVLEESRKKVASKLYTVGIILVSIALLVAGVLYSSTSSPMHSILIPLVVGGVIFGLFYGYYTKSYTCDFKLKVIKRIVEFIDPVLGYEPSSKISRGQFEMSGIFRHRIDTYCGDDYVAGILDKTNIEFSELHAEYITRDSKGNTTHHTIFKGLFFVADFNKHFVGKTYVLPDAAERMLGGIGTFLQKANKGRGNLVKLEDVAFEKEFAVYSNDQIEARYILTHNLMERILEFKKKTKKKLYMSFINASVYVAIPYAKDLFEPRVFKTLIDFEPIQEYYEDLTLAISIVEELNLNTRIWTKE